MKNDTSKLQKAAQRILAIEQGYYDGRFRLRTIGNKKAKIDKISARKRICLSDY